MSIKKEMLSKRNWAIYGITTDTEKFGYKIPEVMKENGYNVIGINKKYKGQDILGIKVYGSLEEVTEEVDCIDEAIKKGIKNIWFQPHTFNEEVIEKVKKADINYVDDDCVYAILTGE